MSGALQSIVDRALHLQQAAGREVDEQQAGARIAQQVAQGVEEAVAAEIGHDQRVAPHTRRSPAAAAMRDVEATARSDAGARAAGDEEGVGRLDRAARCRRARTASRRRGGPRARRGVRVWMYCAQLPKLWSTATVMPSSTAVTGRWRGCGAAWRDRGRAGRPARRPRSRRRPDRRGGQGVDAKVSGSGERTKPAGRTGSKPPARRPHRASR